MNASTHKVSQDACCKFFPLTISDTEYKKLSGLSNDGTDFEYSKNTLAGYQYADTTVFAAFPQDRKNAEPEEKLLTDVTAITRSKLVGGFIFCFWFWSYGRVECVPAECQTILVSSLFLRRV